MELLKVKADSYFHIKWSSSYATSKYTAALVVSATIRQVFVPVEKSMQPYVKIVNSKNFIPEKTHERCKR